MSAGQNPGFPVPGAGNWSLGALPALALAPARGNAGFPGKLANARLFAGNREQPGNGYPICHHIGELYSSLDARD